MTLLRTLLITFFLVTVVAFLLIADEKEDRDLDGTDLLKRPVMPLKKSSQPKRQPVIKFPNVVPLSELGDFNIKKTIPKKLKRKKAVKPKKKMIKKPAPKPKPTPKPLPAVQQKPPVAPQPAVVSKKAETKNTRPSILAGYDKMGLHMYLRAVEEIGTLHLIIDDGNTRHLGPKISFMNGRTEPIEPDAENQVIERPNLIEDEQLAYLMTGQPSLPVNALSNQVVLYFNKQFDEKLWNILKDELNRRSYQLSDIATVKADYSKADQNIHIFLDHATTKSGRRILINRDIKFPCRKCDYVTSRRIK